MNKYIVFIGVLFVLVFLFIKLKRKSSKIRTPNFAIEDQRNVLPRRRERQRVLLRNELLQSGFINATKIDELVELTLEHELSVFKGDEKLSLEEKKSRGLNPKRQYSERFIGFFNDTFPRGSDPKEWFEMIYSDSRITACCEVEREDRLKIGISEVAPLFVEETRCSASREMKGRYRIEDFPNFPLPNCDRKTKHCHCSSRSIV
jgi:hypothetical protein